MANTAQHLDEALLFRILDYIRNYQAEKGYSPTRRDIVDYCDINLKRANKYVHALAGRGYIELDDDGSIVTPSGLNNADFQFVPKIGAVRCGQPTLAVEDYDGVFRLPRKFTGSGEFFMLEAKGDSMINANIFEGDYLVIRKQETADYGDIVVACRISNYSSDEDGTLKRYLYNNGHPILHAENDSGEYKDMDASEFRIIGKLKCIIRDMDVVG